ncbi:hypothetical protein ACS0ZG_28070 [Burkholderia gladioli]|uniref:hypothetical protein n=1 Tax=Burkholderia gladioli TaxID=28095 RepID=UPI003F7A60CE
MTTETRTKQFAAGVAAATAALAASDKPIFLQDEVATDAYAMGWNSVWAGDENKKCWAGFNVARAT